MPRKTIEKVCRFCGQVYLTEYRLRNKSVVCSLKCRNEEHRIRQKDWCRQQGLNEDPKITRKKWVEKNKEKLKIWWREYREKNRAKMNIQNALERDRVKKEVFSHYATRGEIVCAICGFADFDCLQIDHILDNGADDRRNNLGDRTSAGTVFYRFLRKNNYPQGYQLLCANCNCKKELMRKRRKLYDDNAAV